VAGLIDWREDAALPARTASWPVWTLAMGLVVVLAAAVAVAAVGSVSGVSPSICRLHETREGIPNLEKMDVPLVGEQPPPGWVPPKNVRVRYTSSADAPSGSVTDETMCGQPVGQLLVTIAH
jgi:hypothetical protein